MSIESYTEPIPTFTHKLVAWMKLNPAVNEEDYNKFAVSLYSQSGPNHPQIDYMLTNLYMVGQHIYYLYPKYRTLEYLITKYFQDHHPSYDWMAFLLLMVELFDWDMDEYFRHKRISCRSDTNGMRKL
jgi:hypothetical protein